MCKVLFQLPLFIVRYKEKNTKTEGIVTTRYLKVEIQQLTNTIHRPKPQDIIRDRDRYRITGYSLVWGNKGRTFSVQRTWWKSKKLSRYAIFLCGYFRSLLRDRREFLYDEKENTKINLHYLRNEFYHLQMLVAELQTAKGKDMEQIKDERFRTSDIR